MHKFSNILCNGGKNITIDAGKTFTCIADGSTIIVTITSNRGDHTWRLTN
ncbi:MAG: hypothetical protein FWD74_03890 [Actinomycetia bacterium]|nr:hypothetical protein [Actinomycetes bacterium]